MRKKFILFAGFLVALIGYCTSKVAVDNRLKSHRQYDIRRLPSPDTAAVLSVGFKSAMADVFWIEALNYFGWQLTYKQRTYEHLDKYLRLIFRLDPLFPVFYDWAATAFIYNALPITRAGIVESTRYVNEGIQRFHDVYRYDLNTLAKGAFNYAIETNVRKHSIPYFEMAARTSNQKRDYLLVASSYATTNGDSQLAYQLKKEYLGFMAFEAAKPQLLYALQVLSSSKFNSEAANFTRALRIRMEKDEDIRKLVEQRLQKNPFSENSIVEAEALDLDQKIDNVLAIDFTKNWLPPDLHALTALRYQ